jgi:hypothetical protein
MAVLPNGVVLLHSFNKTLELIKKYKNEFPEFDTLYKNTELLALKSKPLINKTKRKLEKRHFIVKEICGLITTTNDTNGILACGVNSVVGINKDNKIFYTLLSDNPKWYLDYMKEELQKCGVSEIYYTSNTNSLEILRKYDGSLRCQHNTISNQSLFKTKKRSLDKPTFPPQKRIKVLPGKI